MKLLSNMLRPVAMIAAASVVLSACTQYEHKSNEKQFERALLISIDGMRAIDLSLYVKSNPESYLATLVKNGTHYAGARQPLLGDSTPGLLSFATGGTPAVSGLFYSPFYDRRLSPPGSGCSSRGTVYWVDEKWVNDYHREDSGGGIDPSKLALDPDAGCTPVYPRQLLKVNTMFEVVKSEGGRTSWIDQHAMYNDMLLGKSGDALDENISLERKGTAQNLEGSTAQDGRRTDILINQIRGYDRDGKTKVGVPALFGMGFISFGMVQKSHGYNDLYGNPSATVVSALNYIDKQLGRIVKALVSEGIYDSTLIVLSSKHGQNPIDIKKKRIIDRNVIRNTVNGVKDGLLAWASLDAIGMIWLNDDSLTGEVVSSLHEIMEQAGIQKIYAGEQLDLLLPVGDSRVPDIIIQPELGTFYAENIDSEKTKALIAEHGGMLDEDTNVVLVVSHADGAGTINRSPVSTSQIAPTILTALGIDPEKLDAVKIESTQELPGWR